MATSNGNRATLMVGYDGYARLTSYIRSGEANLAMAYNGMDQRVALTRDGITRRMVQDGDGRLLGEYAATPGQPFSEYIWLLPEAMDGSGGFGGDDGMGGWAPLAVVTADGAGGTQTLHWLHSDHLGRPVASYDASGIATILPTTTTALAFPGQQITLADLYYNQYRDYDPTSGRYIQADPIGLVGDVNPYVYAGANPVMYVDPTGEVVPLIVPIIIGTGTGAAIELGIQAGANYLGGRCVFDWGNYEWGEVAFGGAMGAFGGHWVRGFVRLSSGSMKFSNVSRRIRRREGLVGSGIDLHHWLIPRRYENLLSGRMAHIVNRPWNLNPMLRPSHGSLHRDVSPLLRPLLGSPQPVRGAIGVGTSATAIDAANGKLDD